MGPPVVTRRWSAAQVKEGIADPAVRRLRDLAPLERDVTGAGRRLASCASSAGSEQGAEGGFAAGQPQYTFQIPLVDDDGKPLDRGRRPRRA